MKRAIDQEKSPEELLYPNTPAFIEAVSITKQTLKGGELKCELVAVTNVPNLAVLTPEAWTEALFELILGMHRGDYEHFKQSCTSAVRNIKTHMDFQQAA